MTFIRRLFGNRVQERRRKEMKKIAQRNARMHVARRAVRIPISTFMITEANKKAERLERILDLA